MLLAGAVVAQKAVRGVEGRVGERIALRGTSPHDGKGSRSTSDMSASGDRWHSVTVALPEAEVRAAGVPAPLAGLEGVEVRLRPAPGERGTEIAARSTTGGVAPTDVRLERMERGDIAPEYLPRT